MAEFTPLPTDYVDDILSSSNTRRKYQQTDNPDGTKSFTDVTEYDQEGTDFGALDVNRTNKAINDLYANRIVSLDDLDLVTETGFFVDALAVKELLPKKLDKSLYAFRDFYDIILFETIKTGNLIYLNVELLFTGQDPGFLENNLYSANVDTNTDESIYPDSLYSLNIVSSDAGYTHAVSGMALISGKGKIEYSFPSKPNRYIFINGVYRIKGSGE